MFQENLFSTGAEVAFKGVGLKPMRSQLSDLVWNHDQGRRTSVLTYHLEAGILHEEKIILLLK